MAKTTGTVTIERHGFPLSDAGFHFGIMRITLSTSASSAVCVCCLKVIFVTVPSFSTTKDMMTVPCSFFCNEREGYFNASVSHLANSDIPPGNSGSPSSVPGGISFPASSRTGSGIGSTSAGCIVSSSV